MLRNNYGLDEPRIFNAADVPLPAHTALPLQVVASLPKSIAKIHFYGSLNQYVDVFVGPPQEEQWICTVTGGPPATMEVYINGGSRISLRSVDAEITTGSLSIQFYGD